MKPAKEITTTERNNNWFKSVMMQLIKQKWRKVSTAQKTLRYRTKADLRVAKLDVDGTAHIQ